MTSVWKSKLDWKVFVKKKKLETQLTYNRKDGYMDKKNFLFATK